MGWKEQAEYVTILMHLKNEVNRELDQVQVGAETRPEFLQALVDTQIASRKYERL